MVEPVIDSLDPGLKMVCPACNVTFEASVQVCVTCGAGLLEVPDSPLLSGQLLDGRYQIGGVVGSGGMGTVYRAEQVGMERAVAIKVMHAHYAHDPRAVKRFFREAQAASRLIHPNIVTVYDFGRSEDGHLYMVMELLEGWTLGDLIHYRAPLEPSLAIAIASQVCDALDEAHKRRIVHRDLKPDNILVSLVRGSVWAKVLDFGIARAMRDRDAGLMVHQSTVEIAGTPAYMSPEQILGQDLDPRSDLYSLGVILYEMLTRQRPFDDENSVTLCMKQLNDEPVALNTFREDVRRLDEVVHGLLHKSVDGRPSTAGDTKRRLLACPQAAAPVVLEPIDPGAARGLGAKTTRGNAAALMAQPTLNVAYEAAQSQRLHTPALGGVALPELSFPGMSAAVAPKVDVPQEVQVAAVARVVAESQDVISHVVVCGWIEAREAEGWEVDVDGDALDVYVPAVAGHDAFGALLNELSALQGAALDANLALRTGAASCADGYGTRALDLARRLAASAPHGRVVTTKGAGAERGHREVPRTSVFLPGGAALAAVSIAPASPSGGALVDDGELLWGRSIPLRRLGQIADEARRTGLQRALLVGAAGFGKSAALRSFVRGRRHVMVRVAPAAELWPGHTVARLVAASLGLDKLTGRISDLAGLSVPSLHLPTLHLLLCDKRPDDAPSLRSLAALVGYALEQRALGGPLVIAIDDADGVDEASRLILEAALAAHSDQPWLLVASTRTLKPQLLCAEGHRVELRPLGMRSANSLLDAYDVPPRRRHSMIAAAQGNPRALQLLARTTEDAVPNVYGERIINVLLPEHLRGAEPKVADSSWVAAATGDAADEPLSVQAAKLYLQVGLDPALASWLAGRLRHEGPIASWLASAWVDAEPDGPQRRAERCERLGMWRLAATAYETSLALVSDEARPSLQLRAATMRACAGDVARAVTSFDASVRCGMSRHRATELLAFATLMLENGEIQRAQAILDGVRSVPQYASAPKACAGSAILAARAAVRRSDGVSAMSELARARASLAQLRRTDARGARALEGLAQEARAEVALLEGDLDSAQMNLQQSHASFRDLGMIRDAVRCLIQLGRRELDAKHPRRALATFKAAHDIAIAHGYGLAAIDAETGRGDASVALSELEDGARLLRSALKASVASGYKEGVARASLGLGRTTLARGMWADAVRHAERAVAESDDAALTCDAWLLQADALVTGSQGRRAQRCIEQAHSQLGSIWDGTLAATLRSRALGHQPETTPAHLAGQ